MEHYGSDFNATGSVMSRAELEDQRRKRGECVRCGQKCFQKKLFKMIPITEHGKVENGRCLNCNPLDASAGAIPAVSRPATQADLRRFSRSQNVLRSQSTHSNAGQGAPNGGMEQRRSCSQPSIESDIQSVRRQYRRPSQAGGVRTSSRSLSSNRTPFNGVNGGASAVSDGQYMRDRSMDGDASVVSSNSFRGAFGSHITGRSSDSLQSGPMNDSSPHDSRGVDATAIPPPGTSRPVFTRPGSGSSRSVSASSYYSRTSDNSNNRRHHADDEGSVDGADDYGRSYRQDGNGDHPSDHFRLEHGVSGKDYPDNDYSGVERAPRRDFIDHSNLDYYQRSNHEHGELDNDSRHDANCESFDADGLVAGPHHPSRGNVGSNHESVASVGQSYHLRPAYQRNDSAASSIRGGFDPHRSLDHSVSSFEDETRRFARQNSENEIAVISDHNGNAHRAHESVNGGWINHSSPDNQHDSMDNDAAIGAADFPIVQRLREVSNDYVEILNIMRDYHQIPTIQSFGMQMLSNLQLSQEDCHTMTNLGAIQVIIEGMVAFADVVDLQVSGCRAMWNASFTAVNQLGFVDNGALDVLSRIMSAFAEVTDLQEQALSVLANLGAAEPNLKAIVEKGIVARIVDAMNRHVNNVNIQNKGCLVLANLAAHNSPLKSTLLEGGAGSAIVICMVMHPLNPELQEKALRALRNLSANCDANRIEITNIGGIDAIVSAMQVHRDVGAVQEAGAWSLSNLAGNADSRILIGDCGGIDVAIRAMWVHSDNVSVQEWCCRALFTLSLEERNRAIMLEVGGISAIVNAMQAHNDSPSIQEMACAVLYNLAAEQQSKMRIVDEEALDAVVLAMVLHSDDDKVQERACQLLLELAIAENFKAMQASNVGELVRSATRKFPDICGEIGGRLIEVIEGYISGYS